MSVWKRQSEWDAVIAGAIEKLENGERLEDEELQALAREIEFSSSDEFEQVAVLEGDDHRWQREVSTIVRAHGRHWRIDWMRALTENSEDEFWEQPVEVKPVTRVVPAHEVTEYVEVEK